jgi:invasion protein IalB
MMKDLCRPIQARFALPAAVAALMAASPAFAQAPAPAAPAQKAAPAAKQAAPATKQVAAPPAPPGPPPEWLKVCGKDEQSKTELCSVASYILDGQGNVRGQIRIIDVTREKEKKRIIEAMIPPGFLIQPGINLVIDDNKTPIPGRYRVCFTNACVTEVLVSDDMLANIRKGSTLNIFFANQKGEWLGARVSLAGFSAAYDGKPLDPKVAEEKRKSFEEGQNKLQSELAKRAEEQRKKLQEGAAATPAAPAAKTQ